MYDYVDYKATKSTTKVTKSDLSSNITEYQGHKIASKYAELPSGKVYTLVYLTKPCQATLVDDQGTVKYIDADWLNESYDYLERSLDWLTWQVPGKFGYSHTPLSNFYVERDGKTLEHRFAAAKTNDLKEKAYIFGAKTPGTAKKRGRKCSLRPDWDEIKRDLMWDLLLKKFMSNDWAREYLLATDDAPIREKNTWNDRIWGVNLNNQGQNLLGMGLMYVRDVLND